jgi:hypothetical protein
MHHSKNYVVNFTTARTYSVHQEKSSGVYNWYLDDFFEFRIHLRQMIYLSTADDISSMSPISCWLSSLAVEYHLLWTIISYVEWYSSPANDIQLKQMILIWRGWYSSWADDICPMETIFIQERRISSMMVDSWNYNHPLEMIFIINHWRWQTGDDHRLK